MYLHEGEDVYHLLLCLFFLEIWGTFLVPFWPLLGNGCNSMFSFGIWSLRVITSWTHEVPICGVSVVVLCSISFGLRAILNTIHDKLTMIGVAMKAPAKFISWATTMKQSCVLSVDFIWPVVVLERIM